MKSIIFAILSLAATVMGEDLQTCGASQYYPSQYTCFDGGFLCPKSSAGTYLRCGDACYLSSQYSCSNNQLVQRDYTLPEPLLQCGAAQFYPSQYVCFDNYFLCPVINGQAYLRCGAACYNNFEYTCVNDALVQLPQPTCVWEYGSCEDPMGQYHSCCTGLSCIATKCRNLTTIGH